ncbi:MAG TPA: esterase-like activity of phytase family protein [Candidatus Polarisedimenticolaceae bacterium]|nr:esterase-like activity of phytase family protein [Candidatus Polarisedimenticolaceae bacterium]
MGGERNVSIRLAIAVLGAAAACHVPAVAGGLEPIATLGHPPLGEVSGIARSSRPGVFWVHNDSGDRARVFAVTLDGEPVVPIDPDRRRAKRDWPGVELPGATNVDWEDIAFEDGTLYIADTGNNGNARRDLGLYLVREPDPHAAHRTEAVRFLPLRYPDQTAYPAEDWEFDCEALFVDRGTPYFLTKHRAAGQWLGFLPGTKLYRLDTRSTEDNVLTLVGKRADLMMPTAADLSPDGRQLAVLTYMDLWIFDRPAEGDDWLSGPARRLPLDRARARTNEAIAWADDRTVIIANEERRLFRLDVAELEPPD